MKKFSKVMMLIGTCVLMTGGLGACGSTEESSAVRNSGSIQNENVKTEMNVEATNLSGSITMSGSTSMEKMANALSEVFMEKYPDINVTVEFTGSGAGIEAVSSGTVDIGNSSRNLKEDEKASGTVENIVAIDGIAVCLDPANTVVDLTKQQLTDIYTGAVSNWSELGGNDAPIVVVGREAGSGTRGAFEELLEIEDACAYANELDSTGAVIAKVASTPGAIGYASLDALNDTVTAAKLEGVEATAENIKAGEYFLCRPFVMATKGEISAQSEVVQKWFEYVLSAEGQEIAAEVGLITVK